MGPPLLKGDRKGCASLIEAFASDNKDAYQLGLTKVFLRKNAHDSLETARSSARRSAAVRLQSFVRRRQALAKVGSRLRAGRALSRWAFAALAIQRVRSKRRDWNVLRVETAWRCARHRNRFRAVTRGVLALQKLGRGVGALLLSFLLSEARVVMVDVDGDGTVDYKEFAEVLKTPDMQLSFMPNEAPFAPG